MLNVDITNYHGHGINMSERKINFKSYLEKDRFSLWCIGLFTGLPALITFAVAIVKIFGHFQVGYVNFKDKHIYSLLIFALVSTIFGLSGLLFKYFYLQNILSRKTTVIGFVKIIYPSKYFNETGDSINIEITYKYSSQIINRVKSVPSGNIPHSIKQGSEVTLFINPKRPKQFIISDLYK
jgi:hypothetical protein